MATIICRTGYCPVCESESRPHKGSIFVPYGGFREKYYDRTAIRNGVKGFTPHIYILKQVTSNGVCIVETWCTLTNCRLFRKSENIFISIKDWNALVADFKRDPQYHL